MKKVSVKVTLERTIWLSEDSWEGFGEVLPNDMEDLEMLQDESLTWETILTKAEVL